MTVAGLALCLPSVAYAAGEDAQIETVVVTGSRLQPRGFEAPTPVSVVTSEELKYTGTVNVENLLSASPQFVGAQNGTALSNTVQANGDGGAAYTNLRGLGPTRTLVLVNGRRYVVQSTSLITDLNTIPTALIERTEVVTGGSSAVYGSDAIAGVINFVMKQDFEGVQGSAQYTFDSPTQTPIYNFDLTLGGNFAHDKGNAVFSMNYLSRGGFTQPQHGSWTKVQYSDGCVTSDSFRYNGPGTALSGVGTGAACVAAGGKNGLVVGGSSDIPDGRFSNIPSYASADSTLQGLYDAAGLTGMTNDGFTFSDDGTTVRNRNASTDKYNVIATNYMQMPQTRWMMNAFGHYDFSSKVKGYAEFHFSNNTVDAQLTPANANGSILIDADNPYLSTAMQNVLTYLDSQETKNSTVTAGTATYTNSPNDGLVALTYGRRFVENGKRHNHANRLAYRFLGGFKGDLGSVSDKFLRNLNYDVYYMFTHTDETDSQGGSISRSKLQASVLSVNGAAPVCDIFGQTMSDACISAVSVNSSVLTHTEMQNIVASLSGEAFDMPAGPVDFVVGTEWRYTFAQYVPDAYTSSGDIAGLNSAKPTKGSIVVHEAFGEIRVPILSDLPFVEKFSLNSAFRYSDYNISGAKGVWTYSGGADWRINGNINLRGQFQHSIRAPNVGDLVGGLSTNYASGTVDPCGSLATNQSETVKALCLATGVPASKVFTSAIQGPNDLLKYLSGGNPDLKPEKSNTITLGAVFTPEMLPGFVGSVDFYSIDVTGAIASLGGGLGNVLNNCYYSVQNAGDEYCSAIHRSANGDLISGYVSTGNANLDKLKTHGIDFRAQYTFDIDWGLLSDTSSFDVSSAWTYVWNPGTSTADQKKCVGAYGRTCGDPQPNWKGTTRVTWHTGPLSVSLRHRFIDSVELDTYKFNKSAGAVEANYTRPVLPAMHYFDLSVGYDVNDNYSVSAGVENLFDKDPPITGSNASYANTYPTTYDSLGQVFHINLTAKTN